MGAWKLSGCIRVTIGTMAENRRFIQALKAILSPSRRHGGTSARNILSEEEQT
jgi:hypothetical protein